MQFLLCLIIFCPKVQYKIKYSKVPCNSQLSQIYITVTEKNLNLKPQRDVYAPAVIVICMYYSVPNKKHVSDLRSSELAFSSPDT